jgi:hypothetical protein
MAIAIKIEVPWNQANRKHRLQPWLEDADGAPAKAPGPEGEQEVRIDEGTVVAVPNALRFMEVL